MHHKQVCNDRITKEYKGIDEGGEARSEVNTCISSNEVNIRKTGEEGWNIEFDKEPTKVNSCSYSCTHYALLLFYRF